MASSSSTAFSRSQLEGFEQFILKVNDLCYDTDTNVCVTGGAQGADCVWEAIAVNNLHNVAIMSFNGHNPRFTHSSHIIRLTRAELAEANKWLQNANRHLKRASYDMDLLRRNYYQIKYSTLLYAISNVEDIKKESTSVCIEGGTAWACQMFLLNYISIIKDPEVGKAYSIPLFFYDMKSMQWYRGYASFDERQVFCRFQWRTMTGLPPAPFGIYTGIGSRNITSEGRKAIEQLFHQKKQM